MSITRVQKMPQSIVHFLHWLLKHRSWGSKTSVEVQASRYSLLYIATTPSFQPRFTSAPSVGFLLFIF